ncbi:hypothetical protein IC235_15060 [Hymenobacter sp. BT664]|uniref:Uncharacterized protein n=1 Tax=Hymenobacter montanus TaxID=2771359 RepID=A0A927GK85_9BACT|nr:hypothetical protein [Hymenobacter montanus]MBD2769210.1 hypothetical protein [Hymenobacter montanus]
MIHTQSHGVKCDSVQRCNGSKNGQPKYQDAPCRYRGLFVLGAGRKAAQ